MTEEHGLHCSGCRELDLIDQRNEALAFAKAAYEALPYERKQALNKRFDLAKMQAKAHSNYTRRS